MSGPSVACMKGEQGVLISLLAKRRPLALGWSYGVFALSPKNRKLYQFKSELVSGTYYFCFFLLHNNKNVLNIFCENMPKQVF